MREKSNVAESTWIDPDNAPELTDKHFQRADWYKGDTLVRRGRPPTGTAKVQVTLRIDRDVLIELRAMGPGWQTKAAATLRTLAEGQRPKQSRRPMTKKPASITAPSRVRT